MIVEISERNYIDTDAVRGLVKKDEGNFIVFDGVVINLENSEFERVRQAWEDQWKHALYTHNEKGQLKKKTGPIGRPKIGVYHPDHPNYKTPVKGEN
jgi:hypothetical protein